MQLTLCCIQLALKVATNLSEQVKLKSRESFSPLFVTRGVAIIHIQFTPIFYIQSVGMA